RYVVHGDRPTRGAVYHLPLDGPQQERKRHAILCHVSQLWWRRRQLLHYVRPVETFERSHEPTPRVTGHPVRSASLTPGLVRLVCDRPRSAVHRAIVRCVGLSGYERLKCWSLEIPRHSRTAPVREGTAGPVIGMATCVANAGKMSID